jgi:calcium-dependent protein kinase
VLGHGHFGTVRRACRKDTLSHKYAIKSIPKKSLIKDIKLLRRELDSLRQVDHPNIIQLHEVYEDDKYLHLVMELCTGGDLFDNLMKKGQFSEQKAAIIMHKIMSAVNHLHSLHICHRDIKPENFLLTSKGKNSEIKIVDFGLSNKFEAENKEMHSVVGTPYYVAPEVLRKNYTHQCDVWSMGVVLYVLLAGEPPFKGNDHRSIFQKIIKCNYSFDCSALRNLSDSAKDLISKMLVVKPSQRITIAKALEHPWFKLHTSDNMNKVPLNILNSLKYIKHHKRFEEAAIRFIIKHIPTEEIFELNNIFRALDTHSCGFIFTEDLYDTLSKLEKNVPENEKQKLLSSSNLSRHNKISYTEFLFAALERKKLLDEHRVSTVFKFFDVDNSGYITASDLTKAMIRAGYSKNSKDLKAMIKELQSQSSQGISHSNFKNMLINAVPKTAYSLEICSINRSATIAQQIM